jgi:hypothetical protein
MGIPPVTVEANDLKVTDTEVPVGLTVIPVLLTADGDEKGTKVAAAEAMLTLLA